MELNLPENVDPEVLEVMATRFRAHLGEELTHQLQTHLNEVFGPDIRIGIRVEVEAVALKNPEATV